MLAFGADAAEGWLTLLAAFPEGGPGAGLVSSARQWLREMPVRGLADLAVTGGDLTSALDKRPGPWLGQLLQKLLLAAASGDVPNDRTALIMKAKRMNHHEHGED
ncbi:hypothetical protein [Paenibacillus sp. URB8-2]|uniref:hypothetical protein n=1 Tax=Paenibacillus sp. URB8-2 TaxID=2741301 RepID=UPI0015C2819D|nr:hypothetical protein PUR_33120 [Paenibacillus sp. URB8-2]